MDSLGRPTAAAVADAAVADAAVAAAATAVTAVAVTAVAMAVTTACSSPPAASYVDDEVNTGLDFDEEVGAAVLPLPGVRAAGSGLALPSKPAFHRKARDGEKIDLPPSSEMLAHDLERRKHVSNAKSTGVKKTGHFYPTTHARQRLPAWHCQDIKRHIAVQDIYTIQPTSKRVRSRLSWETNL